MIAALCSIRRCRAVARIGLLLAVAGLLGCRTAGSESARPPQYLKVEGRGRVDPMTYASKVAWVLAFKEPIAADAEVALDPTVADAGERLLLAQAGARRQSLRALSRRILALPDATGRPLASILSQKPELAAAFNKLLEDQAQATVKMSDQRAAARATIDGKIALELFRKYDIPFQVRVSDLSPDQQVVLKNEAYDQAMKDLRQRLQKQILESTDQNGEPLSKVFQAHPDRLQALDAALVLTQADDVLPIAEDGTCMVQTNYDLNKAREVARGAAPWWAFWRR